MLLSNSFSRIINMNTSTYVYTDNSLSALLKDLSSYEEHQILGGVSLNNNHKRVCKPKIFIVHIISPLNIEDNPIVLPAGVKYSLSPSKLPPFDDIYTNTPQPFTSASF